MGAVSRGKDGDCPLKSVVSIVRCQRYEEKEVLESLRRSITLIGGIEDFVKPGNRVLLKPNLLYGKPPEKAVTTHPSIIRGLIQIIREAEGIPFIGDSPSVGSLVRAAEKAGIKRVAEETQCPLLEFDQPIVPTDRSGKFFKHLEIDRSVLEADVVVNLPKWKTHGVVRLTLGVKNLFGCVPGPRKALWHLRAGESHKVFAQVLLDLYRVIQPSLTILDGIVGMEGNGPGSGDPISLGLILASRDPLSIDQIVCDLLGIPRESVLTNRVAFEEGMGRNGIEVVGESVGQSKIPHFKLPPPSGVSWNLPGFLKRMLKNGLTSRPVIEDQLCEKCERCTEICPTKALVKNGDRFHFDYGKCIRCFCCQEVCSGGAIAIEPGWALKLVGKG
jgi:uncharacterized protein (DUF362 family)/Pyruvate/2-oxoacid:ferredoxin oxidoreductase delta subunit